MSLHLSLASYKYHHGRSCWLIIHRVLNLNYCPVLAMQKYIRVRPNLSGIYFINELGKRLDRYQFVKRLKNALVLAGIDHKQYNSHSVRIGRITDLALAGSSQE